VEKDGVLGTVEERKVQPATKQRKANWVGHTLRRSCLVKQVIEEKIEGR